MDQLSRRDLLALGAAAAVARPALRLARRPAHIAANPFTLGVCAGDPDPTSAVLWTRLTHPNGSPLDHGDTMVAWEIAADAEFTDVIATGTAPALADLGHSVHVTVPVEGPAFFRFRIGDHTSPVGRVAPAPATAAAVGELRLAAASCQHFERGFYAAHRDIAEWAPDLVVFLGDFIYEHAANPIGGPIVRSHRGGEIHSIDDYRDRYAQYLSDPDLQASRAACPWVIIWDDHEVDNNYAGEVPERLGELRTFADRRLAAYRAWWEHMPVRAPRPEAVGDLAIYRTIRWGALADVIVLDGRQYRSDQACGDATLDFDPPCAEASDTRRTMLGDVQERWLADELAESAATWTVIGQQTVLTDIRMPNGAILNYDQWDGYAPARERLLDAAKAADRVVVLAGDIHIAGIGRLPDVGVEFVTTGITSDAPVPPGFDVGALFPSIVDAELAHRGYTRHIVTPEQWVADYRIVADVARADSPVSTWRTFTVDAAGPRDAVA